MLENFFKILNKDEIIGVLSYGDIESIKVSKTLKRKGFCTKILVAINEFIDKEKRNIEESFVKMKEYEFNILKLKILREGEFFTNHAFLYRDYFRKLYKKIKEEVLIDSLIVCDNNFLSKYRKALILKNNKIYEVNVKFCENSYEVYFLLPLISKYVRKIDRNLLDKIKFYRRYYRTNYVFSIKENIFLVCKKNPPLYYIKEILLKNNKVSDTVIFSFSEHIEKLEKWLRFP